jgi:hypothetical protein
MGWARWRIPITNGGCLSAIYFGPSTGPVGGRGYGNPGGHGPAPGWPCICRHRHPHSTSAAAIKVVASGLNQPKKITIAPDGSLLVALSGDGAAPGSCTDGSQASCLDASGAVDRVTTWGHTSTVVSGLPSVSGGGPGAEATGPVEALYQRGRLQVLFQNTNIDPTTGEESYGPGGAWLGDLVRFTRHGSPQVAASFGPFEAANDPDHGAGTGVALGQEPAIDSDPYSFVPYHGGYVVADAAANDLLFVGPGGHITVLAVFPTITEVAAPGTLGPTQTTPVTVQAQAVPDSVTVGPDGALYVGELGGFPFNVGTSSVYRVVPGHQPTVYARGLTAIGDVAFDHRGRLLVLEIDQAGINDPALAAGGLPTPGAIIRIDRHHHQTMVASTGLEFPTGMAVSRNGDLYLSNYGVLPATGGPGGLSGQIVRVTLQDR